jgi:hypothetical protein
MCQVKSVAFVVTKRHSFVELYVLIGNAHKSTVSGRIGGDYGGHKELNGSCVAPCEYDGRI